MTVEVRPLGDKCNIKCTYCYQEGVRSAGGLPRGYDVDAMIARLEEIGEPFMLFGGEIMMVRDADLERLFAYGLERFGGCGLQTNGTLVRPHHLDLFDRYNVRLGVSIDGPGLLNDARWAGTDRATHRATARTEGLIEVLCRRGRPPTVIVTLHQANASPERLPLLSDWLRFLDGLGVRNVRLHVLEVDSVEVASTLSLGTSAGLAAMRHLRDLEAELSGIRFDVFAEVEAILAGRDADASCIFQVCDSYTTAAVTGVEGDGRLTNCGRTNKDGVGYIKSDRRSFHRQLALYDTPWESGGCQDCRFFLMCKGNCPGMAIDGDWRLRSADCQLWFGLFEDAERRLAAGGTEPLSLFAGRREMERLALQAWEAGVNPTLAALRSMVEPGDG